jgi:thiamine transporter
MYPLRPPVFRRPFYFSGAPEPGLRARPVADYRVSYTIEEVYVMEKSANIKNVRIMVEVALAAALAVVLSMLKLYTLPQGGSLSLEMIPVFYIAVRRGGLLGCLTGLLMGLGQLFFGAYIVHPAQLILDYPLAFTLLGVAGFMRSTPLVGVVVGSFLRFAAHTISGIIFFAQYAPEGMNVLAYSAIYNASYMLPETVITLVVIGLILGREKAIAGKTKPAD